MIQQLRHIQSCRVALAAALLLAAASTTLGQEMVLITCDSAASCRFRRVAAFRIDGRLDVRLAELFTTAVTANTGVQARLTESGGLVRDFSTGLIRTVDQPGRPPRLVLPPKLKSKVAATPQESWNGIVLAYAESAREKKLTTLPIESFGGLLVGGKAEDATVAYLKGLTARESPTPYSPALAGAGVAFAATAETYSAWRGELLASIQAALNERLQTEGAPSEVPLRLTKARAASAAMNVLGGQNPAEKAAQLRFQQEQDAFLKKEAVARAMSAAGFPDEAALKIRELGIVKWSRPGLIPLERQSLQKSAALHKEKAEALEQLGSLDGAFDEAARSLSATPCDQGLSDYFKTVRMKFILRRKGVSGRELRPEEREPLDLMVQEFRRLDESKSSYVVERIGRAKNAELHAPLQMIRAERLMAMGKYAEARAVVIEAERRIPIRFQETGAWIELDGALHAAWTEDPAKAMAKITEANAAGQYEQVLGLTQIALNNTPAEPSLLRYQAMAAAFLRQRDTASSSTRTYLRQANLACADEGDTAKILQIADVLLVSRPATPPKNQGEPHWISGVIRDKGFVYYDPISLGFTPRVDKIYKEKGSETFFKWDAASDYQVEFIQTSPHGSAGNTRNDRDEKFYAEPSYLENSVYMQSIGPRGTRKTPKDEDRLVYLNSPQLDVKLVGQLGQRQVARGWAGNPFFHPFYWQKIYRFDLIYDDKGRVIEARPVKADVTQRPDGFRQILHFQWDDRTDMLQAIKGDDGYSRILKYDDKGRLESEEITLRKDKGRIDYEYKGEERSPIKAHCESDFYDKEEKTVLFLRR